MTEPTHPRTELRLGYALGATPGKWAQSWRRQRADLPLRLLALDEGAELRALTDGTADLIIAPADAVDDAHYGVVLYEEELLALAGRDHALAATDEALIAELAIDALVHSPALPARVHGWGLTAHQYVAESALAATEFVATGSGITVLTRSAARALNRRDLITRTIQDAGTAPVRALWLRENDSPDIQDLVAVLRGRTAQSSRRGETPAETTEASRARRPERVDRSGPTRTPRAGDGRSSSRRGRR